MYQGYCTFFGGGFFAIINAILAIIAGCVVKVNKKDEPVVFLLWGSFAKSKKYLITNPKHLVLEAPHPSPFSARTGFFGCNHFVKTNQFLKQNGIEPIDWQIENI